MLYISHDYVSANIGNMTFMWIGDKSSDMPAYSHHLYDCAPRCAQTVTERVPSMSQLCLC